jgi:hypothetical protein
LQQQADIVKAQVRSDATQYGNLNIAKEPVSNYEGVNKKTKAKVLSTEFEEGEEKITIAPIAEYLLLKQRLQKSRDFEEQKQLKEKLAEMEKVRIFT